MLSRDRTDAENTEIVGLLDIGTSKVACLIAALDAPERPGEPRRVRVLGLGHQRSRGLKAGVITDLAEAEAAVRAAISQAERMAHVDARRGVRLGLLRSPAVVQLRRQASTSTGGVVRDDDIDRLMAGGHAYAEREGRTLIHLNRVGFRVDGAAGAASRAAWPPAALRRPARRHRRRRAGAQPDAGRRALLPRVRAFIATPYASALAATTEEERRLGVTCIDIGGGTATIAVFRRRTLHPRRALPVGGNHITFDIARPCRRRLRRQSESRRYMARWSSLSPTSTRPFPLPLRARRKARAGRRPRRSWPGSSVRAWRVFSGWCASDLDKAGIMDLCRRACGSDGWRQPARRPRRVRRQHARPSGARFAPQPSRACRRVCAVLRSRPSRGCWPSLRRDGEAPASAGPRGARRGVFRARRGVAEGPVSRNTVAGRNDRPVPHRLDRRSRGARGPR